MLKTNQINSLKELQVLIPRVLEVANKDENLILAAAANPLLALEKMGYVLSPKAKTEIEYHARFGKTIAKEVKKIEDAIVAILESPIDLNNNQIVSQLIRTQLGKVKHSKTAKSKGGKNLTEIVLDFFKEPPPNLFQLKELEKSILDQLNEKYPLVAQLVRYRTLQIKHPRFGNKEAFESILNKKKLTPITSIKFRLQSRSRRKNVK